jgi:hypothetical protein
MQQHQRNDRWPHAPHTSGERPGLSRLAPSCRTSTRAVVIRGPMAWAMVRRRPDFAWRASRTHTERCRRLRSSGCLTPSTACETFVLDGECDHRDSLLSADERASGKAMMICVSRARGQPDRSRHVIRVQRADAGHVGSKQALWPPTPFASNDGFGVPRWRVSGRGRLRQGIESSAAPCRRESALGMWPRRAVTRRRGPEDAIIKRTVLEPLDRIVGRLVFGPSRRRLPPPPSLIRE